MYGSLLYIFGEFLKFPPAMDTLFGRLVFAKSDIKPRQASTRGWHTLSYSVKEKHFGKFLGISPKMGTLFGRLLFAKSDVEPRLDAGTPLVIVFEKLIYTSENFLELPLNWAPHLAVCCLPRVTSSLN
jgi:hypothetical protein